VAARRTEIAGRQQPRPRFFWRGLLIILPVVTLAVFGALSLNRDRALVDNEVRERAREFAEDAVERCWQRLTSLAGSELGDSRMADRLASEPPSAASDIQQPNGSVFLVSAEGRLVFPPTYATVPAPSFPDPSLLSPEQAQGWQAIESAAATNAPPGLQIDGLRAFLETKPRPEFAALAHFRLARILCAADTKQASDECRTVIEQFSESIGETGLPLAPLATMQMIEMLLPSNSVRASPVPSGANQDRLHPSVKVVRRRSVAVNAVDTVQMSLAAPATNETTIRAVLNQLGSKAVARPSPLTPLMLNRLADWELVYLRSTNLTAYWNQVWNSEEKQRRLFTAARDHLTSRVTPELASRGQPGQSAAANLPPTHAWPELGWFQHPEPASAGAVELASEHEAEWLAIRTRQLADGSAWFACRSYDQLLLALREFGESEKSLPEYLGVYYQIGGRNFGGTHWRRFVGDPAGKSGAPDLRAKTSAPGKLLASASHRAETGAPLVTVAVSLLDPTALYARQSQRVFWFGGLIAISAIVALVGLLSTRSAFQRQQRLYQMQTNFVSSVSHELRAPIGTVRLLAENLKRGKVPEPAEQHRFFDYIVQECSRLSYMIENVLNLARIEQGRKEYEFEATDVVRLVEETIRLMEPKAAEQRVVLVPQLDASQDANSNEAPRMDGRAIQQALINLIDNAIKHSPANAVVTVGLQFPAEADDRSDKNSSRRGEILAAEGSTALRLWVADHGPGIPAKEHQVIFERFHRRGSELRREVPGVGIGLSIVKHIVEAHGGRIVVESEVGQGSRFIIELPSGAHDPLRTEKKHLKQD
jgi:signal transduction histidine kinase